MIKEFQNNISINLKTTYLSSKCGVYKTEQFIKQIRNFVDIDLFLSKLFSGVLNTIIKNNNYLDNEKDLNPFVLSSLDGKEKFFFRFGCSIGRNLKKSDVVFYKYISSDKAKQNDRRFSSIIKNKESFDLILKQIKDEYADADFSKIYILSNEDQVNFPLLNESQQRIVKLEDNNVVVQGVAGSGKTNICIDKIIYCACRRYRGRVLYSTYSHSLLEDTKKKVKFFVRNIKTFIQEYEDNKVVFLDNDHKLAIEKHLGIWLDTIGDEKNIKNLKEIVFYLENKADYFLIEDLYKKYINTNCEYANEEYFLKNYINNIKNYNLQGQLDRVKNISREVIYKEIYGLIFGCYKAGQDKLALNEYIDIRKDSLSKLESETIYAIALDYKKHLSINRKIDNNIASYELLNNLNKIEEYSLIVLDEVQDFTQVNLNLFKNITMKMFCVGDVLQMINPTYFSFAYLKSLLFEKDIVNVIEIEHNYRNSKKIERVVDKLSELNISQFGTHNFVLRSKSVESDIPTRTLYINDGNFIKQIEKEPYGDLTVVVASQKKKQELRSILPKQEILTISEIKGLERNCVLLVDILSDNQDKWDLLKRNIINKKKAEENSIFRYYFNLLYVGISRAKANLFVVERKNIELFNNFFNDNFEHYNVNKSIDILNTIVDKAELLSDEIIKRINEFISLEQYDNARFLLEKLNEDEAKAFSVKIDIFEKYVRYGKNKEAGVQLWKEGLLNEAKEQFKISGDEKLVDLVDSCIEKDGNKLEYDIVQFYLDVLDNDVAKDLILDTLSLDIENIKENQKKIKNSIKKMRA